MLGSEIAQPSVKQHLAAIRQPFDYLVMGGILVSTSGAFGARPQVRGHSGQDSRALRRLDAATAEVNRYR